MSELLGSSPEMYMGGLQINKGSSG